MTHPLDNPVWSALSTGNSNFAQGTQSIKYYPLDVAPFAGLAQTTPQSLQTLYDITPTQHSFYAVVTTEETAIPASWTDVRGIPLLQMVAERPVQPKAAAVERLINLTDAHIPQMIALAELTHPGPFRERTIDLGHYQGIFKEDRLVAMAGQRMHASPYAEISAVCTHPDHGGRGYATQLMLSQMSRIGAGRGIPFLHVAAANQRAIKIYETLGFVTRKKLFIYFMKK